MFHPLLLGGTSAVDIGDTIAYSLRFDSASSQYLSRTVTTSATFTFSVWVKRSKLGAIQGILEGGLKFNADDTLTAFGVTTTAAFRGTSAWYHIVVNSSGLYVNGTSHGTPTTSALTNPDIGVDGTDYFEGYIALPILIDGTNTAYTSFGRTSSATGEWVPKTYSGSYGSKGFKLDFSDGTSTTTLGYDTSGNGNHWTLNSMTTADQVRDTPTKSFATLDTTFYNASANTFSLAGQKVVTPAGDQTVMSNFPVTTGKWYCEFKTTAGNNPQVGFIKNPLYSDVSAALGTNVRGYAYYGDNGNKYNNGGSAYGSTWTTNDVIGCALDLDNGKIWWSKNGTWQASGNPAAGTNAAFTGINSAGDMFVAAIGDAWGAATCTVEFNAGQGGFSGLTYDTTSGGAFVYTPPTGFKALCTSNLSATGSVTVSGTFTGNAAVDGPTVHINGAPATLAINGNAVTFGTHADKLASGFKLRSSSASYNASGSNTWTATVLSPERKSLFKYQRAKANP